MARASTPTMLPLDRWAFHLGLEPRHFNQVVTTARPITTCQRGWFQYAWQMADQVGREEVASAIAQAEYELIELLGYYPIPQWVEGEVQRTSPPWDTMAVGGSLLANPSGHFKSVKANVGHIISGGIRATELIGTATIAGGTMVWTDLDGDGYDEIARITLPYTGTDDDEIRAYFPSQEAADEWEIRPLRAVTCDGVNVVVDIDRHLLVDPDLWEDLNPGTVDGDLDANFLTSVDIYRVYNDPSQQVQFQWERLPSTCYCGSASCTMCAWAVQWGCLQTRDPKLGIVTYQAGEWDATTETFTPTTLTVGRQPERVRLYYRAGYQSQRRSITRPMVQMEPDFERMIVIYSITLLDRPVCNCSNVEGFYKRWTEDRALVGDSQFKMSVKDLECPWGTRMGAIEAYRQAVRRALGRAVRY